MEVEIPYEPRAAFLPFHNRTQRWSCLVCHRRAGKTVACVNELVTRALYTPKKNARYAYIAPFYRQAKDVAWVYLKEAVENIAVKVRESDLRVELPNGAWITLYGADNPDALRGLYLDGVILDEYGDCRPSLWAEVVLPTLADRKGWATFIGTPKGKNHFYQVKVRAEKEDNWYFMTLKASTSGLLDDEELTEMQAQMTEDQYAQELECSFEAAVQGTYYASTISMIENRGQIRDIPHDPDFPVHVSSDLGFTDSSAFWFWQIRPDGIAMIDYYEEDSKPLAHYFEMFHDKPYEYDSIWLPHDAKATSLQTGRSTIEQFLAEGFPCRIVPKQKTQHGIDAARLILPAVHFDQKMCYDGIEALRAYRRQFSEITNSFSNQPLHDWSSNGADAFRYFALVSNKSLPAQPVRRTLGQDNLLPSPEWKLEELYEDRRRGQLIRSRRI